MDVQVEAERKHEALVREWQAQLLQRQAEMDALQAELAPPPDLELLKLQVREADWR